MGLPREMAMQRQIRELCSVQAGDVVEEEGSRPRVPHAEDEGCHQQAWDNVTGVELNPKDVKKARS